VKDYCCKSWYKILENRVSVQDFIFAKEVRMGTYRYVAQLSSQVLILTSIVIVMKDHHLLV